MLLIKNVKIIDGTGTEAYASDVLVSGNRISAIGNFPNRKADQVIEGLGGYLMPGFIDVNTDADHQLTLFTNPHQEKFLKQGVTTIIGGHCGSSLAPLLYGSLESIGKWTDPNQINVDWHDFREFVTTMKQRPLGVNFGSLVGHSTIRRAIIGEDSRDLTKQELTIFTQIIKESLEEGALGFSTGLSYVHSRQVPYNELKQLVSVLRPYKAVYSTHLRDEKEDLFAAVNETITLFQETGVRTVISHFRPLIKYEKNFEAAFNLIDKTVGKMDFFYNLYPFDTSIVPIYTFLPLWAQKGGLHDMLSSLTTAAIRARVMRELPTFKKGELIIASAPGNEHMIGKQLGKRDLIKAMLDSGLKAQIFHKNINEKKVIELLFAHKSLIGSNSGGLGERSTKTFPKFLELVEERENYPLEKAVQKITSLPAEKFNISERGQITEGYFADLALVLNNQVKYVIVNGQVVIDKGEHNQVTAGTIITRG